MALSSDFDRLYYLCEECNLSLSITSRAIRFHKLCDYNMVIVYHTFLYRHHIIDGICVQFKFLKPMALLKLSTEIFKFHVDKNAPLPTGESVEKLNEESYPEHYHVHKYQDKSKR